MTMRTKTTCSVGILWALSGCYQGVHGDGFGDASVSGPTADGGPEDADGDDGDDETAPPSDEPPAPGQEFECQGDAAADPGPFLTRRLNRAEYLATVDDVLGVDARDLRDRLPPDYRAEGFTNNAANLIITTDDVASLADLAEQVADRLPPEFFEAYAECTDWTTHCEEALVHALGLRMYRRPVEPAEVASMIPIFAYHQGDGDDFEDAARSVVQVMLQAPPFMYRLVAQSPDEASDDGIRTLDGYEIASRLSYLVWGSAPDDELLDAAAADELRDPAQRVAQVERMLTSPRTRQTSQRYLADWLHLDRLEHLSLPNGPDMREETEAFFEEVVWEQERPLPEMLDAQFTYATPALAEHYGLTPSGEGLQRYDLSDVAQRGGLLTQASFLSWEDGTASMVQRGLFVLEELACGEVAAPPAGVNCSPPKPEPGKSMRHYAEERMATNPCGACHKQIDRSSFAFEQYDGQGRWRATDEHGNELRSDGVLATQWHDELPYDTAEELAELLANDDRVAECSVIKMTQFALGRPLVTSDGCALQRIRDAVADDGVVYGDVLAAIVAESSFAQVRVEPNE